MTTLTLKSYQQAALHSVVALESAGRYQPRKRYERVNFECLSFRLSLLNFFGINRKINRKLSSESNFSQWNQQLRIS